MRIPAYDCTASSRAPGAEQDLLQMGWSRMLSMCMLEMDGRKGLLQRLEERMCWAHKQFMSQIAYSK